MTRRAPLLFVVSLVSLLTLLPDHADAQARPRGRVVAPRAQVVVGGGYFYRPWLYDPWLYGSWMSPMAPFGWGGWGYPPAFYGQRVFDTSGSLRLQVTPRQTQVFIDGYYAGTVDDFDGVFQRLNAEPGEHDLQLFLPGHRILSQKIYLQPGNTFRVRHTMEPLAAGEPEPARPAGSAVPRSPVASRPQAPLDPARARERNVPANADYGSVAIRVQPDDAVVLIDGERWDRSASDERLVVQLAPGRHTIEVRKDGYRGYVTEIAVSGGETTPLNVALTSQ